MINNSANSGPTKKFYDLVQHIFVFLSGSTNRWDVLKYHLKSVSSLTPKPICTTRWSSRIDAMKPLRRNPGQIIATLREIQNTSSFRQNIRDEAESIADKMDYEFFCFVCVWYDILSETNIASKSLQSISSNVQAAVYCLESLATFLNAYKDNAIENFIDEARYICERLDIEHEFRESTMRRTQNRIASEEEFSAEVNSINEVAINSIAERFESLKAHTDLFSFLYDFEKFEEKKHNGSLLITCQNLKRALTQNGNSDIDGNDLFCELSAVSKLVENENITHTLDILNAILNHQMENLVPNVVIAYRILLTTPVSVGTGERTFSKLKLIKNYLRNSMHQNRLNNLAIISIEHETANSIEYEEIIHEFASVKARKQSFNGGARETLHQGAMGARKGSVNVRKNQTKLNCIKQKIRFFMTLGVIFLQIK
ncbi:uncharacterized protein LOC129572901 [Sitodiplosis mosellana]|uniref:uncharacterized protein LOC129572901 n=1 Tax=Sitodiplosis mosellana TaxID=263140 RepID=UPI0024452B70|nr:uncharacterized protein LOC129572901 [Sitodiplosis mosellana]